MPNYPFTLVGELINHSFARARRAWEKRDIAAYQQLAMLQAEMGANYLTINIDGTQQLQVRLHEMLEFLPELIPAIQEVTSLPLAFDNPACEFHEVALNHYDRDKSGQPILNSVAASRERLDDMIALTKEYDTLVIIMASEKFTATGGAQCLTGQEVHASAKRFAERLTTEAGRRHDQLIIDPGLAPVSADTYGLVNMGLDGMKLINNDPDLDGVHISVGLTNFSFGVPKQLRVPLENAYITIAKEVGLDYALANPEKNYALLEPSDRTLNVVKEALAMGRPLDGETQEDAGFRQAEKIMDLFE